MESEDLLYTSLSPDHAIVTTGSHGGFKVFSLQPFALISESLEGNFKIVEIYEGPSLLILVGAGEQPAYSPRRLSVWNCSTRETICETRFEESVLSVRTNKIRITVATIDKVFIYNTSTMKTLTVLPTADNPKGLQALSPSHSDCFLIFPASEDRGLVQVYDCFNMQSRSVIEAHNSRLAYLSISNQGHLLATASMKGTMMRVFTLPEGKKLFTFKRGIIPAEIYSIFFSVDSNFLVTTSSTGTVHVYDIRLGFIRQELTWTSSLKSSLISAASYILPESYKESLETSRSFITAKVNLRKKFTAALLPNGQLVVISLSGEIIFFSVDLVAGGEARVIQQLNLHRREIK